MCFAVDRAAAAILSAAISLFAAVLVSCPAWGLELPKAGINLNGYSYWGTSLPFVDCAHMGDQWISTSSDRPVWDDGRKIRTTSEGYPASLATNQIARSLIFTHNGKVYPTGNYTLRWSGDGDVRLSSPGIKEGQKGLGYVTYQILKPDDNGLLLEITRTTSTNPVRDIRVRAPLGGAANETFNAKFRKNLANYGVVRYMDWNATNDSQISKWSERTTVKDLHWGSGSHGVPYEMQIQLSNELAADCWITVPHLADDDYVANLAQLVKAQLKPGLRAWVEYSNEVWNGQFKQQHYAKDVLQPKFGVDSAPRAYGRRAAEIFEIFSRVLADRNRVVRVIAGQLANSWILEQSLIGATVNGEVKADVASVAAYFSLDVDKLYQKHVAGAVNLDQVFAELDANIDALGKQTAANRAIAQAKGLPLVAYEAGQHLVARPGEQHNNASFVLLLQTINRDPRMGAAYTKLLNTWTQNGGATICFFNDIAPWNKWGSWGLQENYLDTRAAKFRAVQEFLGQHEPAKLAPGGVRP